MVRRHVNESIQANDKYLSKCSARFWNLGCLLCMEFGSCKYTRRNICRKRLLLSLFVYVD